MAEGADEEEIQFLRTVRDASGLCSVLIKEIISICKSLPLLYPRQIRDSETHLFGYLL